MRMSYHTRRKLERISSVFLALFVFAIFPNMTFAVSDQPALRPWYDPDQVCATGYNATTPGNNNATVVIDPGHSGGDLNATNEIDGPASGNYRSVNITGSGVQTIDNDGAPGERATMWQAAGIISDMLSKAGYRVILTKKSVDDNVGLLTRAKIANDANAAIAVSLHYTGGVAFGTSSAHWGVTPQAVGEYRKNASNGKTATFTDAAVAQKSNTYAQAIQQERAKAGDNVSVAPLDTSFPPDRGLPAYGNISIVQLFSKVPWVYNEDGADKFDIQKYATGIANGIMKAVPITLNASNPPANGSGATGTVTDPPIAPGEPKISTFPNIKTAYEYFIANLPPLEPGVSAQSISAQAAGIVGNMMVESTPNITPTATNGSHWGIVQWDSGRYSLMKSWVSGRPAPNNVPPDNDPNSLQGQMSYVIQELKTSESSTLSALKKTTTALDAATVWNNQFERSQEPVAKRGVYAQSVYAAYSGLSTSSSGTSCTGFNSVTVNCGGTTSGGTTGAKILCEAQKYNGLYYRYGGGPHGPGAYTSFKQACPDPTAAARSGPLNQPTGAPPLAGGLSGGTSPCATDCSGLVSAAVSVVTGQNLGWTVGTLQGDTTHWQKIDMSAVQAGDVVTIGDHHVEIVDHYDQKSGNLYTFGSHNTGTKTSAMTWNPSEFTGGAFHFKG